jgi:hypothetical protein
MNQVELERFMEGFADVGTYAKGVKDALEGYERALETIVEAQEKLAVALAGTKSGSRALFSNSLSSLGDTASHLTELSAVVRGMGSEWKDAQAKLGETRREFGRLEQMCGLEQSRSDYRKMLQQHSLYEKALLSNLKTRIKVGAPLAKPEVTNHRLQCEGLHFQLVKQMNDLDRGKKLILTSAMLSIVQTFRAQSTLALERMESSKLNRAKATALGDALERENVAMLGLAPDASEAGAQGTGGKEGIDNGIINREALWGRVEAQLHGEILGQRPPPGAPSHALSPDYGNAIRHAGMYLWSLSIKTQLLADGTRSASEVSMRHVRDGVYVFCSVLCSYFLSCL